MNVAQPAGPYRVYSGRVTNWAMVVASAVLVVPLLGLGAASSDLTARAVAIPVLIAAAAVLGNLLTATEVRTTTGPDSVRIRFGVLGWPRATYPAARIERAEIVQVGPGSVSLGYWWTPRGSWCTVRTGPALRLTLVGGRTVTVTVPQPEEALAALRGRPSNP